MITRCGNNIPAQKHSKGFTLIELIVTVAILSFGIVVIYEALFISVDTYGFYINYLETQDWIDEKIAEKSEALTDALALEEGEEAGQIVRNNKTFDWTTKIHLINEKFSLYDIEVTLSWNQGGKRVQSYRQAYLLAPQLKEYEEILTPI